MKTNNVDSGEEARLEQTLETGKDADLVAIWGSRLQADRSRGA